MPPPAIKRARSRGYGISYEDAGSGPAVVLLPGWTMSAADWRDTGYVDRLAIRYRVLNVDPLGNGLSDKPHETSAYRQRDVAADVVAVLDAEGVSKASVWGYSRGAWLAINVAADHPNRVMGLILGGGGDLTMEEPPGQDPRPDQVALAHGDFEPLWETFSFAPEDRTHDLQVNDPRALAAMSIARSEFGEQSRCSRVSAPALVYVGDEDDPEADRTTAEAIGASYRVIPGLNHLTGFSEIDLVLPMILEFLESISSAGVSPRP